MNSTIHLLNAHAGVIEFRLGDLRGGAASPVRAISPISSHVPIYDLSRADELERRLHIVKIQGDGRCLFRALVRA